MGAEDDVGGDPAVQPRDDGRGGGRERREPGGGEREPRISGIRGLGEGGSPEYRAKSKMAKLQPDDRWVTAPQPAETAIPIRTVLGSGVPSSLRSIRGTTVKIAATAANES